MKLYFAAPLFTTAERTWNADIAAGLRAGGHEVYLPQEGEIGKDGPGIFAADVGGLDWSEALVGVMDGPDPDSGTSWEVGYTYAAGKPIVLVRTDIRILAGSTGAYNAMLVQSATERVDLAAGSADEVIAAILDALARIAADRRL